ncbi:TetR/AcrR family transcriptional regulator [Erwinia sp. ErVv1]|uniref:TetR/AcrR family transcriptional regulator n=1 Tax=Erwinia sp. ErVv1 TaxID=1603299 RepID=UPI00082A4214|nr:TetR/AcrR family transcriptional regulator [Erwinia sp. ErVv1]
MKTARHDTREHILTTGEALCVQRGFNGMGLIELLKVAEVPKGSFYYYFPSKEAFGVAMLERYFAAGHAHLRDALDAQPGNQRQSVLDYYHHSLTRSQEMGFTGCLSVKLSAEVCDLSEPMRNALDAGSKALIATLTGALERAVHQGTLCLEYTARDCAQNVYTLWLGASLQSKVSRDSAPLFSAWQEMKRMLPAPA